MLRKVISGGQIGADQAGNADLAIERFVVAYLIAAFELLQKLDEST